MRRINLIERSSRDIRPDFKTVVTKDCSLLNYGTMYSGRSVLIVRRVFTPPVSRVARYVDEVYYRDL
jgi:hypothetical protein